MPADTPVPSALAETRVLDGPNMFFTRPAIRAVLRPDLLTGLPPEELESLLRALRMRRPAAVGEPGTHVRLLVAARVVETLLRRVAVAAGTTRLGVRSRAWSDGTVVVAYPWQRLGRAKALAEAVGRLAASRDGLASIDDAVLAEAEWLCAQPPGDPPALTRPSIPTVCITGTNGKTTVTRLVAHIAACAGHRVAWCTSDGVYVDGELVEAGDLTGFVGARGAVTAPGVTFAVVEAARGGMLRRGLGIASADVGVVTNVSADHLGQNGIDTLDQLAEVKGTVLRVARSAAVVNAEDPRALGLRRLTRATPWAFSLDAASPGIRTVLDEGGSAVTVIDGCITLLHRGDPVALLPVEDVPMTILGLSRHNLANALAAAAAASAAGVPHDAVVEGLRSFQPDPTKNPGRLNLWDVHGRVVIVDYAHNEAGLQALLDVAQGLRREGGAVHLVANAVGDRTDDILLGMGELAGKGADTVVIAERASALRGRTADELWGLLRDGLAVVGVTDVPGYPSEVDALAAVLATAAPGDVCAVMCHDARGEVFRYIADSGGRSVEPADLRTVAAD